MTQSSNQFAVLNSAYDVAFHWPFFEEGMLALNDSRRARANYTKESFFGMLCKVALLGDEGLLCLLTSKNNKPLGFGCGFTAIDFNGEDCFYVWAAYASPKCKTALEELFAFCDVWCRKRGHKTIKMSTPRITGAANRLFEDKLGFRREAITFRKDL